MAASSRSAAPSQHSVAFASLVLVLIGFGLVMAYSASFADSIASGVSPLRAMRMQFVAVFVGIAVAVALWKFLPIRLLSTNLAYVIWAVCLALVIFTAFFGVEQYGCRRWLNLGFLEFQPAELMKIALAIVLAKIIADYHSSREDWIVPLVKGIVLVVIPVFFILGPSPFGQSDFGTTLICIVGVFSVMLLGRVPIRWLIVPAILVLIVALIAIFSEGYRSARITAWLDPFSMYEDAGYQAVRGYYAFANGGLTGVGLGQSHEKFGYLPMAENDFIFAVIGEELGLLGCMAVVLLFFVFLVWGLRIAFSCEDEFAKMLSGSIVLMVAFEAFLNICCTTGILPITGKPLPFFSMGGTVLLVVISSMGLVLAASRDTDGNDLYLKRRDNFRLVHTEKPGRSAGIRR